MGPTLVMGLGLTGRAVVDALHARGRQVVALDDRPTDELRSWAQDRGVAVTTSADARFASLVRGADVVVPAPGLPDHHPVFELARAAGVAITSEFDLAQSWDDRPAVAVTGTDGKTTVVTLIERMLETSGVPTTAVGNTDTPWVTAIDDPRPDVFVVEASSFRLGHSRSFSPAVGVWLNFGPDHLDAHADLDAYEQAKASIWARLAPDALALANRDEPVVMRHANQLTTARVETWGLSGSGRHRLDGDTLVVADEPLIERTRLPKNLPHDLSNALAASAAAIAMGATRDACAHVLASFTGLEHRIELVLEHDGVRWVNDSKATTPHAAAAGLAGFDSVVLLAGGRNKGLGFAELTAHAPKLRHVVALGEAADDIAAAFVGRAPTTIATSMLQAIDQAAAVARSGDVVLLSPACASFDWYRNYRERGEDFAHLVRARFDRGDPR